MLRDARDTLACYDAYAIAAAADLRFRRRFRRYAFDADEAQDYAIAAMPPLDAYATPLSLICCHASA